jgi:hypothetical protein
VLTIDRMRLRLPREFQNRARRIARLVAEELAAVPLAADRNIDRLTVGPIGMRPGAGDREVARAVAGAIGTTLRKETRQA